LGEIKSTLDLVLEKTKNLTLSKDEKLSLAREELEKKIGGLLDRYLNNIFPISRLKEELKKIASNERNLSYKFLKKHLLAHFNLDSDNSSILSALSEVAGFYIIPLTILQNEYQSEKEDAKKDFTEKSLLSLQEMKVSGSAVVPNLYKIPDWDLFLKGLRKRYQERLKSIESG